MPFNPFNDDAENTSFEQGMPLNQAARNVAKATATQTDDQIKAANQAIVDQLYGTTTPSGQEQGTDEANTSHTDASNAATRAVSTHGGLAHNKGSNTKSNQTQEDQAKLEKIRHELFTKNYGGKFG